MSSKDQCFSYFSLFFLCLLFLPASLLSTPNKPAQTSWLSNEYLTYGERVAIPKFEITIPFYDNVHHGTQLDVTVLFTGAVQNLRGFDFLIKYHPGAVAVISVEPGPSLFVHSVSSLESFGFRIGEQADCGGSACEAGFVDVFATIRSNNALQNMQNFDEKLILFTLKILVTSDYSYECWSGPIQFIWYDCFDNTIRLNQTDTTKSSAYELAGTVTDISKAKLAPPDSIQLSKDGILDSCLEQDSFSKIIDFNNGRIEIVCYNIYIDDVGDINLNGINNEVVDYELFRDYFLKGISVFTINIAGQIASTDINGDGEALKLEDLAYLNQIIIGEAIPVTHSSMQGIDSAIIVAKNGYVSLRSVNKVDIIWLKVSGNVVPSTQSPRREIMYHFDSTHTRILVSEPDGFQTGTEELFTYTGSGEIIESQAATHQGKEVILTIIDGS